MDTEESNAFQHAVRDGDLRRLKSLEANDERGFEQAKRNLAEFAYQERQPDIFLHLVLEHGLQRAATPEGVTQQYPADLFGEGADFYAKNIESIAHAAFNFAPKTRNDSCGLMFRVTDSLIKGKKEVAQKILEEHPINPYFVKMVLDGKWHDFAVEQLKHAHEFNFGPNRHFLHVLKSAEHLPDLGRTLGELTGYQGHYSGISDGKPTRAERGG